MAQSADIINIHPRLINPPKPQEDDLALLGRVLRRDWKIVAVTMALTTLGAGLQAALYRPVPQYVSEMMMLLYSKPAPPQLTAVAGVLQTQKSDLDSEIALMRSQSLVAQAIQNLPTDLQDITFEQLTQNLSIEQAGDTGILTLRYTGQSATEAAILILAKSYSTARNRGMVMPSERAKRARAVERAGFI